MLPWRPSDDERGSASLEFIVAGLLLLVPIVYLILALGAVQNAALGTEATARFVARTIATGDQASAGVVRDSVAAGYGLDPGALAMRVDCVPATGACPTAGATVVVTVSDTVPLPFMPDLFGLAEATAIPVDATGTYRVERLSE